MADDLGKMPPAEAVLKYAAAEHRIERVREFAVESNRIEGIDETDETEVHALGQFLDLPKLSIVEIQRYVAVVQPDAKLRERRGRNVNIRDRKSGLVLYRPPEGGIQVVERLDALIDTINAANISPGEAHAAYESLHPFTDGNGRSGRAIWAWHMEKFDRDPFGLGFLHTFYYQALELTRRQAPAGS